VARDGLTGPASSGGRFPALRHPDFQRYVLGQSVSLVGFWMQVVAQGWLVYRLSGSELALGAVSFASYSPALLFSPLAGAVVDRIDKWRFIMLTQTAAMLLALALGVLAARGVVTVPIVAVLACALGTVAAFDLPARQAFLVDMVGGDDLPSAIAMNASIFNTARVVGPALAGILVATVGEAVCFLLNGASYIAVLWALGGMRLRHRRRPVVAGGSRGGVRSALRYVRAQPTQAALLPALGLVSALGLQANVLMPSLALRGFGRGAGSYGLLLTAYGVGALISALRLASRRWTNAQHRRTLLYGLLVFGAGLFGVAASPSYPLAVACQLVAGLGMLRFTATTNTMIQLLVDDAYRGRVMGLHTMMFMGVSPIGGLLLGAIAEPLGPRLAILASAAAPLVAAAFLWRRLGGPAARD
jgi:MFS family permease